MGACYSTQARASSKDLYVVVPSDMPQPSPQQQPQLHKPYGGRYGFQANSNQQSTGERTVLTLLSSDKEDNKGNMNRFGFKSNKPLRSDANSNVSSKAASNESMQSIGSSKSQSGKKCASTESQKRSKRPLSYNPKDGEKWRLIDEDSSVKSSVVNRSNTSLTNSPAKSTKSNSSTIKDGESVSEDIINANVCKQTESSSLKENRDSVSLNKKNNKSYGLSRIKGPFATKATAVHSQDKRNISSAEVSDASKNGLSKSGSKSDGGGKAVSSGRFLRRGFFSRQKTLPEKTTPKPHTASKLVTSASVDVASVKPKITSPKKVSESQTLDNVTTLTNYEGGEKDTPRSRVTLPDLGNPALQKKLEEKSVNLPSGNAPIAMIDSIETTSCGSVEDLMLDTEIQYEDTESQNQGLVEQSNKCDKGSLRPRSKSRDEKEAVCKGAIGGINKPAVDKKPPVLRRHTEGSLKKRGAVKSLDTEPLQELNQLLEQNAGGARSQPRQHKYARPNSFPGDVMLPDDPSARPSSLLRPPRKTSNLGDDELVVLDAFTYRTLMQEITNTKTMLLRLKRLMQDDTLASPLGSGPGWPKPNMNGYKVGSAPSTPSYADSEPAGARSKFPFGGTKEEPTLEALVQENAALRERVAAQQQQLEEQDTTIHLLQTQMTKYEHVDAAVEGGDMQTTATQTDQQPRSEGSGVTEEQPGSAQQQQPEYRKSASVESQKRHEKQVLGGSSMVESGIDMTSPASETIPPPTAYLDPVEKAMLESTEKKRARLQSPSYNRDNTKQIVLSPTWTSEKSPCSLSSGNEAHTVVENSSYKVENSHDEMEQVKSRPPLIMSDSMTDSQIFERQVMADLEGEEEEDPIDDLGMLATMDADHPGRLVDLSVRAKAKELIDCSFENSKEDISFISHPTESPRRMKKSPRPDLLRGVDAVLGIDDSDQDSTIDITAHDISSQKNHDKEKDDQQMEKQSGDSGLSMGLNSHAVTLSHVEEKFSPSDTSSFSLAVVSTEVDGPDTEDEESDLPLDSPAVISREFCAVAACKKDVDLGVSGGGGATKESVCKSNIAEVLECSNGVVLRSGDKKRKDVQLNSTFCVEEEDVMAALVPGGGEDLANPVDEEDVVGFVSGQCQGQKVDKITKDMEEVEDCMNKTKILNDTQNLKNKSRYNSECSELNQTYNLSSDSSDLNLLAAKPQSSDTVFNKTRDLDSAMGKSYVMSPGLNCTFQQDVSTFKKGKILPVAAANDSGLEDGDSGDHGIARPFLNGTFTTDSPAKTNGFIDSDTAETPPNVTSPPLMASTPGAGPQLRPTSLAVKRTHLPTPGNRGSQLPRPGVSSGLPRPSGIARGKSLQMAGLSLPKGSKSATQLRSFTNK